MKRVRRCQEGGLSKATPDLKHVSQIFYISVNGVDPHVKITRLLRRGFWLGHHTPGGTKAGILNRGAISHDSMSTRVEKAGL